VALQEGRKGTLTDLPDLPMEVDPETDRQLHPRRAAGR
jgi:hypothetical protein